jgi:hypothetical protein
MRRKQLCGMRCTITTQAGGTLVGDVLEATTAGTRARFPQTDIPGPQMGDLVTLRIDALPQRVSIEVQATIESRCEIEMDRHYWFRFERKQAEGARFPKELRSLLNQRLAYRVSPVLLDPLQVNLTVPEDGSEPPRNRDSGPCPVAELKDISVTGMAVTVEPELDAVFSAVELVEVSFCLPPSRSGLKLMAWIRNRRLDVKTVTYGLEFDQEHSDGFLRQQHEITSYVMRRQRETLQMKSDLDDY